MRRLTASLLTLVLAATAGCGQAAQSQPMASPAASDEAMTLSSPAVAGGELLTAYRCEPKVNGVEASLPLVWTGIPSGAASLAVTMTHHPDASDPAIVSSYLLLWAIPPTARGIPAGAADDGPWLLGANKDGVAVSYTSPCSKGVGTHTYTVTLYALAQAPAGLPSQSSLTVSYPVLMAAIDAVPTLGTATLVFTDTTP